jgi:hypothetical protein
MPEALVRADVDLEEPVLAQGEEIPTTACSAKSRSVGATGFEPVTSRL